MEQKNKLKLNSGGLLVFILTVGVFGIINTEMGVVGILPLIAETFNVSVPQAGCFCIGGSCFGSSHSFVVFGN